MKTKTLISIFLFFLLTSCGLFDAPSAMDEEIAGTFQFKYPSGQIEVIEMQNDYTYTQTIHLNGTNAANDSIPLYKNSGTWTFNGARQLEFDHWLSFCEMSNPNNIRDKPELSTQLNIVWDPPNKIWFYDETGYIFERIVKH